jgi:5'-3' exonuclease
MPAKEPLYLVDASIYIFRAYFSLPDSIQDKQGNPCNALYGYTSFLLNLLEAHRPQYVGVAFDESLTTSFRNKIYPAYKANREPPPADLALQMKRCKKVTELLGMQYFVSKHYEADDLIGTVANKMRKHFSMTYVTGDKDLCQLVQKGDRIYDVGKDRIITHTQVKKHLGVHAHQVVDLLAMMGDAVDNIPGVPGIGNKTACALLEKFGTLDVIYENLEQVVKMPLRGAKRIASLLESGYEQALLSQQLAEISVSAPVKCTKPGLKRKRIDIPKVDQYFLRLGTGQTLVRRLK